MKFSEVAHHYLGCQVVRFYSSGDTKVAILSQLHVNGDITCSMENNHPSLDKPLFTFETDVKPEEIKPILKRLIDLTEEDILQLIRYIYHGYTDKLEKAHMFKVVISENRRVGVVKFTEGDLPETFHFYTYRRWSPEQFTYLLRQGYDLFGLIDADEAIDAKTWKKE